MHTQVFTAGIATILCYAVVKYFPFRPRTDSVCHCWSNWWWSITPCGDYNNPLCTHHSLYH